MVVGDARSARVCVPAGIGELKTKRNQCFIVGELAALVLHQAQATGRREKDT
jgi:hypothetical protein